MKICHVTSAHDTDDVRIFEKECVSLAKKKSYQVYLVGPGSDRLERNVSVVGVGNKPKGRINRMLSFSKIVISKALEIDADVYHLHDPELLLYVSFLKKKGKTVIFDSHEEYADQILSKEYLPKLVRKYVAWLYVKVENRACKGLDGAISTCLINGEHPFAGRVKNVEIIDNTPISKNFSNIRHDSFDIVCCVGSLTQPRGIEQLIDACYLAKCKLILGGYYNPDEFGESLKKKKEYTCVDYRGYCNRQQVVEIYKEASICASTILPVGQYHKANNLPTKIYECMLAGMPIILSNFKYNEWFIKEYKCGLLVDPYNVKEIANAIIWLRNNPNEAKAMGENGRKVATELYTWEIDERRLFRLYEDINNKTQESDLL